MSIDYYQVCIPNTARDYYDYFADGLTPDIGARVEVSFRNKTCIGLVMAKTSAPEGSYKLKPILSVQDVPSLIDEEQLKLYQFVAQYYQAPLSQVLALALPKKFRLGDAMALPNPEKYPWKIPQHLQAPLALNDEQQDALSAIMKAFGQYQCFLLQGVTGSGKTEVYLHAMKMILEMGKQVLVIVPEIGLTPQLLSRFQARFAYPMVVLHSSLNETKRKDAWRLAREGIARIVIGTRSAVFTPMPSLGLIIVDEEHDASLKQMEGVRYHGRDVALIRAHQKNIPVVLGTATPCFESLHNALFGKYHRLILKARAVSQTPLEIQLVDMRREPVHEGVAKSVLATMDTHLARGEQVLVFINRRGFSPVLYCQECAQMADCFDCDSHLTLHKAQNRLICHHCGASRRVPLVCDACKQPSLVPVGMGTQRLEEVFAEYFPKTAMIRIDRDEVRKKNSLETYLQGIADEKYQLIVGTQMLAKGHDFPKLTLVVMLDTDNGLCHPDFRAQERLGQLVTQVSGRAGRAHLPGKVMIQTLQPQHPMLNTLLKEGFDAFATTAIDERKQAQLPPYQYLALIRAQAKQNQQVLAFLHDLKAQLGLYGVTILGPAPAPLGRKQGYFQWQLLVKSGQRPKLGLALTKLRTWLLDYKIKGTVKYSIDVDPIELA